MTDVHEDFTVISFDNRFESALAMDHLNNGLPLEPPLDSYEGMKFASIEDAKNYYTMYTKNKGFRFRMGRDTKLRANGMIIGQEILCSKDRFRRKKCGRGKWKSCST
ncbi:hypothetical protein SESBI_45854 [Sesbania bispinosa]|nr:hypothetical protein SESBI_45854 [Sesbania bispinosa]